MTILAASRDENLVPGKQDWTEDCLRHILFISGNLNLRLP